MPDALGCGTGTARVPKLFSITALGGGPPARKALGLQDGDAFLRQLLGCCLYL